MAMPENVTRYVRTMYPLGILLAFVPLLDWGVKIYPVFPGAVQWRYGAELSLIGALGIILTGLGVLGLVAAVSGHRLVLRGLALLSGVGALAVLALLVVFVLDGIQMRGGITDENLSAGITKSLISGFMTVSLSIVVLASLAWGMWRAGRGEAGTSARGAADSMLVRERTQVGAVTGGD